MADYSVYNRRAGCKHDMFSRSVSPLPANFTATMLYVPMQSDCGMYDEMRALEYGTLFPVLNKPFYGKCCK